MFLRTKFICIIWTLNLKITRTSGSWGLSLFVLFEPFTSGKPAKLGSWGLSLFVLFEPFTSGKPAKLGSWGLSLFVLFELLCSIWRWRTGSWGLSLFVLFERSWNGIVLNKVLED